MADSNESEIRLRTANRHIHYNRDITAGAADDDVDDANSVVGDGRTGLFAMLHVSPLSSMILGTCRK